MSDSKHLENDRPCLVSSDAHGNIHDLPELLMVCRKGNEWALPKPEELIPLPDESQLMLLPGRKAAGLNPQTGEIETVDELAVAAFAAPAYTLSAHPSYITETNAPLLPLFAYAAVGFAQGRFWICATLVDHDQRQKFCNIPEKTLVRQSHKLLREHGNNRLVRHLMENCVGRYRCPAARNFALGRYEAPLPTSRSCNANCIGCISHKEKNSPLDATPQCRLAFTPTPEEILGVMRLHEQRESKRPIFSFGQGCEGDPLANSDLLAESIRMYRSNGGTGTVNCNTNASLPDRVISLANAGLTSLRVSCNSARKALYDAYYRPNGYCFDDVLASIREARKLGVFVSLNLLFFPGITDTEEELEALARMVGENGVAMIQWRNLNIDPEWYFGLMPRFGENPSMGLKLFMQRLKKLCPWLIYGYFNPWLGEKAKLKAPKPGDWKMQTETVKNTEQT